jgi:hypothetical protein
MKGLEGPSGPGMPGGPPDLAFPATCSTRKCRVPGRAAGTRSITSSTDFSDHRRLLLIPAACESAQRCAAFSWPVTFWNMSGPIISPHKPLDGRCSSFIDFQSGYHNTLSRDRRRMSQRGRSTCSQAATGNFEGFTQCAAILPLERPNGPMHPANIVRIRISRRETHPRHPLTAYTNFQEVRFPREKGSAVSECTRVTRKCGLRVH